MESEVERLKAAMNRLGDELRMVSVRLCNATIGEGDIQRMLDRAASPSAGPRRDAIERLRDKWREDGTNRTPDVFPTSMRQLVLNQCADELSVLLEP